MVIVHFSTVHYRDDSRIRSKMMKSLSVRYPGQVKLFVQDGKGNEVDSEKGYLVVDTGPRLSRVKRMLVGGFRMFRAIYHERPALAHFHDPELIPWAILLSFFGTKVVYDVHEDYPKAVSENYRLPLPARKFLPPVVRLVEFIGSLFFSGIVTVTPKIESRFPKNKTVLVRNFPVINEYHAPSNYPMNLRSREVTYIGTITKNRNIIGILEAIDIIQDAEISLRLAGDFPIIGDESAARSHPGWSRVHYDGWVSRDSIANILASSRAGLVVLKPIEHEALSLPIKLFEYMAAGLPLISSDFPLWRDIIEDAECGLLVDPLNSEDIAKAIRWIVDHPDKAQSMGVRGRQAILTKYNWENEVEVLFQFYGRIMGGSRNAL